MVRAGLLLAALALLVPAAALSQRPSPASAITNCDTSSDGLDGAENEMISLVNAERSQQGLGALAVSPTLNRMAAWKSEDSSASGSGFSHTDSLGRSPFQRALDCGYPSGAAENIAYGYPSAQATLDAWMNSPGHRANILNAAYVALGVGHSGNAWTMNFGFFADGAGPPPAPQPTSTPTNVPTVAPTNTPPPTNTPIPAPSFAQPQPSPTPTNTPVVVNQPAAPQLQPAATATPALPAPSSEPPATQEMSQGLNKVTYSGPTLPVRDALRPIGGHVEWVYTWNGVRWLRYVPGMPSYINTLTQLQNGTTYIIALRHDASWDY